MNEPALAAGDFAEWLSGMESALRGETDADVPCDGCIACCTASQFIHIGPDETDTLAHVPEALLFPAPRMPKGHVLLGYDERGHCPMLRDGACSIYDHRPRACRTYDCRLYAATGVSVDADKPQVAARVARWRFGHPTQLDADLHRAVVDAAAALKPPPSATATEVAVRAIETHRDAAAR